MSPLFLFIFRRPGLQPRRKPPQNNSSPNPFLALTHAPVISTGMNDSSRLSPRGWPTLSSRASSGMTNPQGIPYVREYLDLRENGS